MRIILSGRVSVECHADHVGIHFHSSLSLSLSLSRFSIESERAVRHSFIRLMSSIWRESPEFPKVYSRSSSDRECCSPSAPSSYGCPSSLRRKVSSGSIVNDIRCKCLVLHCLAVWSYENMQKWPRSSRYCAGHLQSPIALQFNISHYDQRLRPIFLEDRQSKGIRSAIFESCRTRNLLVRLAICRTYAPGQQWSYRSVCSRE